LATKRD